MARTHSDNISHHAQQGNSRECLLQDCYSNALAVLSIFKLEVESGTLRYLRLSVQLLVETKVRCWLSIVCHGVLRCCMTFRILLCCVETCDCVESGDKLRGLYFQLMLWIHQKLLLFVQLPGLLTHQHTQLMLINELLLHVYDEFF
jgi:hypothetical protein